MSFYHQLYADGCHSGYIDGSSTARGVLAWSKKIGEKSGDILNARSLLGSEKLVVVEGMSKIVAFSQDGTMLWRRDKWSGTPVVLKNDWLFYTNPSRKDFMNAIDLDNVVQLEDFRMPNVGETSYLVLFEPLVDGLIAQVQYPDIADQGGMAFIVYRVQKDGLSYQWSKRYVKVESPLLPIVCTKKHFLLTTTHDEALIFDIESENRETDPVDTFNLPMGRETRWVSGNAKGNLVWAGIHGRYTTIAETDIHGKSLWQVDLDVLPAGAVMPPIVTPTGIFVLTQRGLTAIENGKRSWTFKAQIEIFAAATALSDGTVLAIEGNTLYRLTAKGKLMFSVNLPEKLITAPVIDKDGNIYVSSAETLYAIH